MQKNSKFIFGFNLAGLTLGIGYFLSYCYAVRHVWFNPRWTTDDATQQVYPFHKLLDPQLFPAPDLVTEVMRGYLAPLHYWICGGITYLTGDPIMMSHWVNLLQLLLCLIPFVLIIKNLSSWGVAGFSLFWLVHTRTFMQRITGGLPRGWAPAILCVFLYLLLKQKHKMILLWLLCGCLLNPPATMIAAATYGIYLCIAAIKQRLDSREMQITPPEVSPAPRYIRILFRYLLLSPLFILLTASVVKRPEHIGQMVTYQQALEMPAMQRPKGRFPFVPLIDIPTELKLFGYQPFANRLMRTPEFVKDLNLKNSYKALRKVSHVYYLLLILLLIILLYGRGKKLPLVMVSYFAGITAVYLLSRAFAFNFYVPDRHLQQPLNIFWTMLLPYLVWQVTARPGGENARSDSQNLKPTRYTALGLTLLLLSIFAFNGHGFYGDANFNYWKTKKGNVFNWIEANLPKEALIAGHPQHIDAMMLFAKRRALITYEASHPFYPKYFKEAVRRNVVSLEAHYAQDLETIYRLMRAESVDYFVFNRTRFYPEKLAKEKYFEPLQSFVTELTNKPAASYAFKQISREIDPAKPLYQVFRDNQSVVIDIAKLGEFLNLTNSAKKS